MVKRPTKNQFVAYMEAKRDGRTPLEIAGWDTERIAEYEKQIAEVALKLVKGINVYPRAGGKGYTLKAKQVVITHLSFTGNQSETHRKTGVSEKTIRGWIKDNIMPIEAFLLEDLKEHGDKLKFETIDEWTSEDLVKGTEKQPKKMIRITYPCGMIAQY